MSTSSTGGHLHQGPPDTKLDRHVLMVAGVVVLGAIIASRTKLNPGVVAGLQHLAAGVVFAAAATEILPQVKHEASPSATRSIGR